MPDDRMVSYSVWMDEDFLKQLQEYHRDTPRSDGSFQEFLRSLLRVGFEARRGA